jgi:hypothetical protein
MLGNYPSERKIVKVNGKRRGRKQLHILSRILLSHNISAENKENYETTTGKPTDI